MRDPGLCGLAYLKTRGTAKKKVVPIEIAVNIVVPNYQDGGHISSDPSEHHSKVDQTLQHDDGGAS